jgi:[acyl-carrier-protein] S-malonyltransferase
VERAISQAKAAGAKRALPLPVSVPSHCSLMQPAADALIGELTRSDLRSPSINVIHNVDVRPHNDANEIRELLARQLHSPVRWVETIQYMQNEGVTRLVECGPGKVLAGLNKRIAKEMTALPVYDPASLDAALEQI